MIQIRLLGPPQVFREGEILRIHRRAPRALLFYLATENHPVPRLKLGELLWQEKMEQRQRNSLRYTLARLRNALQEENVLHSHLGNLSLNPEHVQVDLWQFCRWYNDAQKIIVHWSQQEPLPPHIFEELRDAAELWYGDEFIQSHDMSITPALEQWRDDIARRLNIARVQMLIHLAVHERLVGAADNALHWLREALDLDDADETAHRLMIEILLETGQRAQAKRHYERVKEIYQEVWDSPPPEELQALAQRIFQDTQPRKAKQPAPKWAIHPTLPTPFVGQKEALSLLHDVHRQGGGVLLRGEAGAGKTRLVQEFYQRLDPPPRLLMLTCYPMEENLPYRPWIEMMRASILPEEWERLHHAWAAPLAALLPEVESLQRLADFSEVYARASTFDAILRLLEMMAQREPLLLVMDDAHWADEASAAALSHLLKASFFSPRRAMLILTARLEEENPHLNRLVSTVDWRILKRLTINGLKEEEIETLGRHLLGRPISPKVVQRLARDTGGNPFFVVETFKEVMRRPNHASESELQDVPIPPSVTRLIQERLRTLDEETMDILACAAIQGNQFRESILQTALHLPEEKIIAAIETLQNASFIRETERGPYAFIHEQIREALLMDLSRARKRALHKAVAEALEAELGDEREKQAALLAHHYEESGQFSKAFDAWAMAGHYAYRLFSTEDASQAYRRAEQLIAKVELSDQQIYRLYALWSLMAFENNDAAALERLNQTLMQIGEARSSPLLIGGAMSGLSDYAMVTNRFQEGLAYSKKALRRLEGNGYPFAEIRACIRRGTLLYLSDSFSKAEECFRHALNLLPEETSEPCYLRMRSQIYGELSFIHTMGGDPKQGVDYARHCLRDANLAGWPYGPATAHQRFSLAYHFFGDYDAGYDAATRGIELAKRIDGWRALGHLYVYAGANALELGDPGQAWTYAQEAKKIGERWGHAEITALAQKLIADIYLRLEAVPDALHVLEESINNARNKTILFGLKYRYALALAMAGDKTGETYIEETLAKLDPVNLRSVWIMAKAHQLRTFVIYDEYEKFKRSAEEVRQLLSGHFIPVSENLILYLQAKIDAKRGDFASALVTNRKLFPFFDETPKFWIEFDVLRLEAYILQKQGKDASEAIHHIEKHLQKIEQSVRGIPALHEAFEKFKTRRLTPLYL